MTVVLQVQMPTSPVGWVVAAALGVVAALSAVGLLRSTRAVWGIVRTDVADVATAPTGERVELEGTVEPVESETVPVAGRPAVLYETDIKIKSPGRHEIGERRWIVEASQKTAHPVSRRRRDGDGAGRPGRGRPRTGRHPPGVGTGPGTASARRGL